MADGPSPEGARQFGNYLLLRQIGSGGFSEVYLATHRYLDKQVAIKLLHSSPPAEQVQDFLREARLLASLSHPNIVPILDCGIQDDLPFLVMAYAPQGSLRTRHPAGSRLPLALVSSYLSQIARGLHYVHERQMIHRDLKPENLLLGTRDEVLLSDLGLALRLVPGSIHYVRSAPVQGTLGYIAPEQLSGKPEQASDQYALGVLVYEWIAGERPFHGTVGELCYQHLWTPPPPLRHHLPDIPPMIELVVQTALAKSPGQRFADVTTFAAAFEQALAGATYRQLRPLLPEPKSALLVPVSHPEDKAVYTVPTPLTRLIGREQMRQSIASLVMQPEVRLLTLTGPGGIGKTRLALAVAADLQTAFADGACFVDLTASRTENQVLHALARALGKETGLRPIIEMLTDFLRDKSLLLVLDNFEQVLIAAPLLAQWLSTCPDVKMLVTSRELLHIGGEQVFPVEPLALPTISADAEIETVLDNPAVALFVERARAVNPHFGVTSANAETIASICRTLEGVPLALELAAARIKLLPPQALLTRLSHRLAVLVGGRSDVPDKLQTMRNTIAWSYSLLSVDEQKLFRRLAIFVDGCSLEALERLYQELDEPTGQLFEGISSLMDKSLLQPPREEEREIRVHMLETLREFGLECLQEGGERERIELAHTSYYLSWAETGQRELVGHGSELQRLWLWRFVKEQGNLHAVMRRVIASQQQEAALLLGAKLGPFWSLLGALNLHIYRQEGHHFLEQALRGSESLQTRDRAWSLAVYGNFLGYLGQKSQGEAACQESLQLLRQLDDIQGQIGALWMLWDIYHITCDFPKARKIGEEAVALARQHGARCTLWGKTFTLAHSLDRVCHTAIEQGHYRQARAMLTEGLQLAQEIADLYVIGQIQLYLGRVAYFEGKKQEARTLLEQGIQTFKKIGGRLPQAHGQRFLGLMLLDEGKLDEASELLHSSLHISVEAEHRRSISLSQICLARLELARDHRVEARHLLSEVLSHSIAGSDWVVTAPALEAMAALDAREGDPGRATHLWGAAQALRERMGAPMWPTEQPEYERHVQQVQTFLGKDRWSMGWQQGFQMSPQEALASHNPLPVAESTSAARVSARTKDLPEQAIAAGLTHRELDVLRLLADGLTNKEIADRLVLSVVTVNSYLRTIYNKLGITSRTAAVRYAIDHHLLEPM